MKVPMLKCFKVQKLKSSDASLVEECLADHKEIYILLKAEIEPKMDSAVHYAIEELFDEGEACFESENPDFYYKIAFI